MKFHRIQLSFILCLLCFFAVISKAQPVWEARLDGKVAFYQTTDFGIVLTGTDRSLYALDGQTGETLWRKSHQGLNETAIAPVPDTDLILLSLDEGKKSRLEAIDLLSGARLWQSNKVKGDVLQLAVEPESDLIAAVLVKEARGQAGEELKRKPTVHVLRLSSGEEIWKKELDGEIEMMPARFGENSGEIAFTLDNYRAPLILDGRLYLFYEGATSFDARTGNEKTREKFKINEDGLALTEADPVFDEKYVYISGRGKIRAVSRKTGEVEWEAKDLGVAPEMALVGNVLYVRTGGQFTRIKDGESVEKGAFGISAIDTRNGKTLWRWKGADKGLTNFVFANADTIFVADKNDLFALDAKNGERLGKVEHKIRKAQFVLINEGNNVVVGGTDEIVAFDSLTETSNSHERGGKNFAGNAPLWKVKHKAPSRGVFRTIAGIALRATALYFRYGGLATSALNVYRGAGLARSALSLRWSGLRTRFSSVDLTSLATSSARNYVSQKIRVYGVSARVSNLLNRINGLQIQVFNLPTTAASVRGKIVGNVIDRAAPSRADVRENLLERLDPVRQVERLSNYFLRRKRLAELRGNFMYFYTDLPKPFDKKGLVGVNVHTGKDARFALVSEPEARFTTDEILGLLYSAQGDRLQAFDVLGK